MSDIFTLLLYPGNMNQTFDGTFTRREALGLIMSTYFYKTSKISNQTLNRLFWVCSYCFAVDGYLESSHDMNTSFCLYVCACVYWWSHMLMLNTWWALATPCLWWWTCLRHKESADCGISVPSHGKRLNSKTCVNMSVRVSRFWLSVMFVVWRAAPGTRLGFRLKRS